MLKYVDTAITFAEVPDEISLCINISNCPCHCKGCHSSYLAEDIGNVLDENTLGNLIEKNPGITCVCFMGGDSNPEQVSLLAKYIKEHYLLKVCWYSGKEELSVSTQLDYFDYIKLGPYIENEGPLGSKESNQHFYIVISNTILGDITYKFLKKEI